MVIKENCIQLLTRLLVLTEILRFPHMTQSLNLPMTLVISLFPKSRIYAPLPNVPSSPTCQKLSSFAVLTEDDVRKLVMGSKTTSCELDPIPTDLIKENIEILLPVLTKMIYISLQCGIFPDEWKLALVIPLIKKYGLELVLKSYRPVSNLPFVGKLTERAVIDQESRHMQSNCPLPECSSAYRKGHSTETALVKVQSDILRNMEQQKVTLLVLIDLSAAFDTVDHNIVMDVLHTRFGLSETVLDWHKSYLSSRRQCVLINGVRSVISDLAYGVPQGSCLGPIIFTQYASSLFDVIHKHLENAHGFADDHQLYLEFSANSLVSQQDAIKKMEDCLEDVKTWMLTYKLKMNDSKTEFLIVGSWQQLAKVQYDSIKVGNCSVKAVDSVRDLGAYLDSHMSMGAHIDAKCRIAFMHLYNLKRVRKYLTREACETLVHSLIFSHIDYCNSLLCDIPQYQLNKFQRIQNMAAKLIFQQPKFSHVTPLLKELHWLPVKYRIRFKLLLLTFKGIHKIAPVYITEMFVVKSNGYASRSSVSIDDINFTNGQIDGDIRSTEVIYLSVPKTTRVTFQARSLKVSGPSLWNALPTQLRQESDLDNFKKLLKTYLFRCAYTM